MELKPRKEQPFTGRPYHSQGIAVLQWERDEKSGEKIPVVTFSPLARIPFVRHGFSTRLGGVSTPPFDTMNLSFSRGDDPAHVRENFRRIGAALHLDPADFVFSDQIHGTKVVAVDEHLKAGDALEKKLVGVDGMISNRPGVVLAASFADCVPLFFVDPVKRAVGLSHSGWRGTVGQIGAVTVFSMRDAFGTKPADLLVVIGPSICPSCYEVDQTVYNAFSEAYSDCEMRQIFFPKGEIGQTKLREIQSPVAEGNSQKYQLDLWTACRITLEKSGVLPEHIWECGLCTMEHQELLWSHRATHGIRGNSMGFLAIGEE